MAQIKKNPEQDNALREIDEAIDLMEAINAITSPDFDGPIQLVFPTLTAKGKGRGTKLAIEEKKDRAKILAVTGQFRGRLVKDVVAKAEKYGIDLEDRDLAILNGEVEETSLPEENAE